MAKADDAAFRSLERITTPEFPEAAKEAAAAKGEAALAAPPRVVVIAQVKVAGYDAAVLDANDAGALDTWLKDNGYASSPDLLEWYKPYIERQWKITAFKVTGGTTGPGKVETSAVRMSFQTDRPFFPYREPPDARNAKTNARALHVYYVGDSRPEGRLGESGDWPGKTIYSKAFSLDHRSLLIDYLKLSAALAGPMSRLTVFWDASSPRARGLCGLRATSGG